MSTAAGLLKEAGLIDYSRGVIRLIDLAKSKAARANTIRVRNHLDNYTEFDSGINEHHLSQVRN